jgi:hypothetical protein
MSGFEAPKVAPMGTELDSVVGSDTLGSLKTFGIDDGGFTKTAPLAADGKPFNVGNSTGGLQGIGSTMQGIGAIAGAAAGMYDAYNKKKYQDKVFGMEETRVARETARQDKQQAAYDKVFW